MNRVALLVTLLAFALASSAVGQPSPTVDQMINALRPGVRTDEPMKLRGIRPPTLSASPQAAPLSAQGQGKSPNSINLHVEFLTNSAELTPEASGILDTLGLALRSETLTPYRFKIVGHTDAPGSADFNKRLSERRAQAVVDYMVTKYAVARQRLEAYGVGSEDPLVRTLKSEQRNRRVQIITING